LENVLQDKVTWCSKDSFAYFIGLLNYDKGLRPDFGRYYSFDLKNTDSTKFVEAIQRSAARGNELDESLLFSYESKGFAPDSIVNSRVGTQAQTFIKYKECDLSTSTECPAFAVNTMKRLNLDIVGYFTIDDKNDAYIGLVYNKGKIVDVGGGLTQLNAYRVLFITRLMQYLTKGEIDASAWKSYTPNFQMVYSPRHDPAASQIVDLIGPDIASLKIYGFDFYGNTNEDLVGQQKVWLQIEVSGSPQYCVVSNVEPDGTEVDTQTIAGFENATESTTNPENKVLVTEWNLTPGSGLKTVSVYCVDTSGIASHKVRDTITLDVTGMELVVPLPEIITTRDTTTEVPQYGEILVRDRYSKIQYCELVGPDDTIKEICDDNNDGVFDSNDNIDNNANDMTDDGCCTVIENKRSLYFWNAKVKCRSPFITKTSEYVPVTLVCRDELGNEVELGQTKIWRWSAEVPEFTLPSSFIFSMNRLPNMAAEDVHYWFNREELGSDVPGPVTVAKDVTFEATDFGDNIFLLKFNAKDEDGMDSCTVSINSWEQNYDGSTIDGSEQDNTYNGQKTWSCSAEKELIPGTSQEIRYSCPLVLRKNAVNNITVTCQDKQGQEAPQSFKITWDEEGPAVVNEDENGNGKLDEGEDTDKDGELDVFETEIFGKIDPETNRRNMKPKLFFEVMDSYSEVTSCYVEIEEIIEGFSTLYQCKLSPVLIGESGAAFVRTRKKAVCEPVDNASLFPEMIRYDSGRIHFYCTDRVNNQDHDTDRQFTNHMKTVALSQLPKDIITACHIIRENYSPEEIAELDYLDLGEPGSVELVDRNGKNDLDTDGVAFTMKYSGDTPWKRNELAKAIASETTKLTIPRAEECATQSICDAAIVGITWWAGGAQERAWKETLKVARETSKNNIEVWTKNAVKVFKVAKGTKIPISYAAATITSHAIKRALTYSVVYHIIKGAVGTVAEIKDEEGIKQKITEKLENSYREVDGSFGCEEYPVPEWYSHIQDFVPLATIFQLGMPDKMQVFLCSESNIKPGMYTVIVRGNQIDMSASESEVAQMLSSCFDSCDDFVCEVTIVPMKE
ncbi:MAG: hypothetical protein J7K68_00595, partial [Candidatus Diapherotrites archaeon]|nr:hypothetical protein [Candidatus Diapherotrites archaeon]